MEGVPGDCKGSENFKCAYRKCAILAAGVDVIGETPGKGQNCTRPRLEFRDNTTSLYTLKNKFCEFRKPGIHGYSVFCRVFVDCSIDGVATFRLCDEGMNFDPLNRICVDASKFNCFIEADSKYFTYVAILKNISSLCVHISLVVNRI